MTNKTLLLMLSLGAGCHLASALKYDCETNADCNKGNVCSGGVCISTSAAGPNGTGAITPTSGTLAPVTTPAVGGTDGGTTASATDGGSSYPMECTEATINIYGGWIWAGSLMGTWIGCDATNLFGDDAQVGIEFAADGSFYLLEREGSGRIVRTKNPAFQGAYDTINADGDSDAQLVLTFPSGKVVATLTAEELPARIHLAMEGKTSTFVGVPVARPVSCEGAPTGLPLPQVTDAPSFWALAQGRWAFCNGFNQLGNSGGIELVPGGESTEDGTFYLLYPDASGASLVRGTAPADIGGIRLRVADKSMEVDLDMSDGAIAVFPDFYPAVNDMILSSAEGRPRFVRIE